MALSTSEAEALIPQFRLERLLNQDQAGRRISLLGSIQSKPAILIAERAAFSIEANDVENFNASVSDVRNLGVNDIYFWFLARAASDSNSSNQPADLKLNLIYPCTGKHIKKYSQQGIRLVCETPEMYQNHVRPYIERQRGEGRLDWIFNIIEGRTEQEDVFYREHGEEGFLVLPDLNWDRKTMTSLHLLGLVERRDIWTVRDLQKRHVSWLKHMREKLLEATVKLYPELEKDQLKLYVHYQPTYHHFHMHIVHVALEAGATQATGKALGLENVISQVENMAGTERAGMADVSLTYTIGEASELWTDIFQPLKEACS